MSTIFPGGNGITISPGQTQGWTFTWDDSGWQGITIIQPPSSNNRQTKPRIMNMAGMSPQ